MLAPEPVAVPAVLGVALLVADPVLPCALSAAEPVVAPAPALRTWPVARSMQPACVPAPIDDPDDPGEVCAGTVTLPMASNSAAAMGKTILDIAHSP